MDSRLWISCTKGPDAVKCIDDLIFTIPTFPTIYSGLVSHVVAILRKQSRFNLTKRECGPWVDSAKPDTKRLSSDCLHSFLGWITLQNMNSLESFALFSHYLGADRQSSHSHNSFIWVRWCLDLQPQNYRPIKLLRIHQRHCYDGKNKCVIGRYDTGCSYSRALPFSKPQGNMTWKTTYGTIQLNWSSDNWERSEERVVILFLILEGRKAEIRARKWHLETHIDSSGGGRV